MILRGELPVTPVFLRELVKALRAESKRLASANAYAARVGGRNGAPDGETE